MSFLLSCRTGSLTAELDLLDELEGGLLRVDVVPLQVGVEESDLNSVVVEQGAGESNLAEDHLEIINALAVLLERHTARVVDQDDNVEERNLDEVRSELDRETPSGRELVEHARLGDALSDLLDRPGRLNQSAPPVQKQHFQGSVSQHPLHTSQRLSCMFSVSISIYSTIPRRTKNCDNAINI